MNSKNRYDSLFQFYGEKHGVDWLFLKAQAMAESGLDPDAKSKVGAKGLSQFMDATWAEWRDGTPGVQPITEVNAILLDPRDPEDAIRGQAAYMSSLLKQFGGDRKLALAAYNWGCGRVKKLIEAMATNSFEALSSSMPQETQDYVKRIFQFIAD